MSRIRLPAESQSPPNVGNLPPTPRENLLARFRDDVDHLAELRSLIRRAQEQERQITAEVLHAMDAAGVERLEGERAVAIRDTRTTLRPDVGLFPRDPRPARPRGPRREHHRGASA